MMPVTMDDSAKPCAIRLAKTILALPESDRDALIAQPLIPHYLAEAFITMPTKR